MKRSLKVPLFCDKTDSGLFAKRDEIILSPSENIFSSSQLKKQPKKPLLDANNP